MNTLGGWGRYPNHSGRVTRMRVTPGATATLPAPEPPLAEYFFDPTVDFPAVMVELSPTTDPLAIPAWERIHDSHRSVNRLNGLTVQFGRSSEIDTFQPGTATHDLDISVDRLLDPRNADGEFFGLLNPGIRIRDRVVWGSRTYNLYDGFVGDFPLSVAPPRSVRVQLAATDLLDVMSGGDSPSSAYAAEIDGEPGLRAWFRLNETEGLVATDSGPNGYAGAYEGSPTFGGPSLVDGDSATSISFTGTALARLDGAAMPTGLQYSIEVIFSHAAIATTELLYHVAADFPALSGVVAVELVMQNDGTLFCIARSAAGIVLVQSVGTYDDGLVHIATVTRDHLAVTLYVDGVKVDSILLADDTTFNTSASLPTIRVGYADIGFDPWSGQLQDVSFYDQALNADAVARHYEAFADAWDGDRTGQRITRIANRVGIHETQRAINTGETTLGPARFSGTNLDYADLVTATEQGQEFVEHDAGGLLVFDDRWRRVLETVSTTPQAVFTDDPDSTTGYRYEPDDLVVVRSKRFIVNDVEVAWTGGRVRVADPSARKLRRRRTITTALPTADQAASLARWFLASYKDPRDVVQSLTLRPSADKRNFQPALALRIGHLITVEMKPADVGERWSQDVLIEGKTHRVTSGRNDWTTTFNTSNAFVRRFFRPGVSSPDGTDGPAF